ncbi:hypothetical protein MKI84_08630 [Ancylobacter sp. A5.8]|uniref:hypothetical protein n=1 Tax=Ancylobacter gelatini TaxID=2919920 RepID=UPI001F4E5619|nr:hypothetical protein [Ancylobacter gelatini]MCJ8142981.1 hypothetical protein [Ancylobacter gelatini]
MSDYDPRRWFWTAEDGRVYSSAAGGLVASDDVAYEAAVAAGLWTPWPRDDAGKQTEAALQEVLAPYGLYLDLAALKAALLAGIDEAAEHERMRYVTAGAGQAMEYQQAAAEAESLLAAIAADPEHEPASAAYPMLAASIGIDGETLAAVAITVAAMHAQWRAIGSAIRAARLAAKAAVMSADTANAARAAAVVAWPGVGV